MIAEELKSDQRNEFDPPYTTMNVVIIEVVTAKNIIPEECRFTLEWRARPGQTSDHVLDLVKEAAANFRRNDPDFIFFFQAEDGIRDFHVTGVQTCALPI